MTQALATIYLCNWLYGEFDGNPALDWFPLQFMAQVLPVAFIVLTILLEVSAVTGKYTLLMDSNQKKFRSKIIAPKTGCALANIL